MFDRLLIVDWSASNVPARGENSIWIADADCDSAAIRTINPSTRSEAMALIEEAITETVAAGKRLFAGFDFAFGYPAGSTFLPGGGSWESVWQWLFENIEDNDQNISNRFEVAGRLNRSGETDGPFWGHPHQHIGRYPGLDMKKPKDVYEAVSEKRYIDSLVKSAKPVWQLTGNGSVGSQALLGIARLQKLRNGPLGKHIAVWPFETKFAEEISKPVVLAELYPSLFTINQKHGEVKDEAQVRTVAEQFREFASAGRFDELLDGPREQDNEVREAAMSHEAWMVGFADERVSIEISRPTKSFDYISVPSEIYRESFATVEAEAELDRLPKSIHPVATRLIHSCGMVDIVDDLAFSENAVDAGKHSLSRGASSIYCDVEMVKSGIIRKFLPNGCKVVCTLNDDRAPEHAKEIGNTRSAAAVDFWDDLEGSIVVIGNAPTALFRLLEKIADGAPKPALVIGIPVGFVGAVESKQALAENDMGLEYITVHGRRGGSAMASSVVNALAGGLS